MENDKNKEKGIGRPGRQTGSPENAPDTPHVTPVENVLHSPTPPLTGTPEEASHEFHEEQPPAKEAIEEKNDRPAANTIMWAVIIAITVMLIVYFVVFHNRDAVSSAP